MPKFKADTPAVSGHVIDLFTNEPLSDAIVATTINTDKDGKFFIPKKSSLGVATPMGGIYRIDIVFDITKEGYYPLSCKCDTLVTDAQCSNKRIAMIKILTDTNTSFYSKIDGKSLGHYGFTCWSTLKK